MGTKDEYAAACIPGVIPSWFGLITGTRTPFDDWLDGKVQNGIDYML